MKSNRDKQVAALFSEVMLAYLRWIFLISIARTACGCDYIRDNVLRQEKLGLSLVSFGLLFHRIFVFNKTYLI